MIWRSRRCWGDATAVQLTRNPDGVARGLAALASLGGSVPGGSWAAPFFVVGPERNAAGGFRVDDFGIVSHSPPASSRIARLRRQGATVEPLLGRCGTMHWVARMCVALTVIMVAGTMIGCALVLSYLALMSDLLILAPVLAVTHAVLRYWLAG